MDAKLEKGCFTQSAIEAQATGFHDSLTMTRLHKPRRGDGYTRIKIKDLNCGRSDANARLARFTSDERPRQPATASPTMAARRSMLDLYLWPEPPTSGPRFRR